ncbi:MAG: hypothetical protein ABSC04_05550 [Syntrophobacteraceae bacterium]|jgi:hypothetical protein
MIAKTCTCSLLGIDAMVKLVIQLTGFSRSDPFPFQRITGHK